MQEMKAGKSFHFLTMSGRLRSHSRYFQLLTEIKVVINWKNKTWKKARIVSEIKTVIF